LGERARRRSGLPPKRTMLAEDPKYSFHIVLLSKPQPCNIWSTTDKKVIPHLYAICYTGYIVG